MGVELQREKWVGRVTPVTLGATAAEGGTRGHTITVGGETTLPFLHFEGQMPHAPVTALEIWDMPPADWPPLLLDAFGDAVQDPVSWAKKCVDEYGARLLCLRLASIAPDGQNASPEAAADTVRAVLKAVDVPLIVLGCGDFDKDNQVFPKVSDAAAGERVAIGIAEQNNYKSLVASCMMNNHVILSQAPIDINIQKQMNILITEMGMPPERILMDPTTGGLGYGLEYCYSIMERIRLGALQGDKMLAMPLIVFPGQESWRFKEAKEPESAAPQWGEQYTRAISWELTTAVALLQAGADVLVFRHPEARRQTERYIEAMMAPARVEA